jgi:hypothetical protein
MSIKEKSMILALQVFGLFFGIWFMYVNTANVIWQKNVSAGNMIIMSAAWTSFITATWLI